jgi:hypothetical protein
VKAEHVNLTLELMRTELDPSDDTDTECIPRGARLGDAIEGVMIGERDGRQGGRTGRSNHGSRRQQAVRRGGVHVQVDKALRAAFRSCRSFHCA